MSIYRAVLLLCALMLVPASALAQQKGPFVRDDLSGTLNDYSIHKSAGIADGVGARLRFDIDYEYKASLLMGEPVVTCSANISDPQGEISFRYDDGFYTVTIDKENAKLLTPYNVDFAITYRTIHADKAVFLARCNTGIPGSWTYDALNVPFSPDWDNFLCWAAGSGFQKPNPMPDSLPDDWCRAFGQGGGRTLDEDEAKKRFAVTPASDGGAITQAVKVEVAAFAINYNDLIVAEIKKISAKKIADRKFEQVRQVRNTLHHTQGAAAQAARQLDVAMRDVKVVDDPLEQARMLQGAMRDVLNIEPSQQDAQAFVELRTFILHLLSSDDERSFVSGIKQDLSGLQAANDQSTEAVATIFDTHRTDAANAPQFTFAELEEEPVAQAATGPADITREIMRIEAHSEWPVEHVVFHPDGKRLLSAGNDKTVRFWDIVTGKELWRQSGYISKAIAITPDGRFALIGGENGVVNVVATETGSTDRRISIGSDKVYTISVSPDGHYVFTRVGSLAYVWNFDSGKEVKRISDKYNRGMVGLTVFSSDIRTMIYLDYFNDLLIWKNMESDKSKTIRTKFDIQQISIDKYTGLNNEFKSEDKNIVILENGIVIFVSYPEAHSKYEIKQYNRIFATNGSAIISFDSSNDGKFILAGQKDGSVVMNYRDTGDSRPLTGQHDEVRNIGSYFENFERANPRAVLDVALSLDGKFAASGGLDGTIRIWGP